MNKVKKESFYYSLSVLSVVLLLAGWWFASVTNESLAGPAEAVERFFRLIENPVMDKPVHVHILASMRRILVAFAAASVVGVSLGVCFGIFPVFRRMFWPVFCILRPIPPLAWIPIVILWFGVTGDTSKNIIIFIGIVMAIVINTYASIRETDPLLLKAGKTLGANKWQTLVHITLPDSIPAIFAGMKTGLSTGWMSVVAAEMIAAKEGIGFLINMSMKTTPDTALDFVGIVLVALCSSLVSFILTVIERKLCPWLRLDAE
ncbi:MAG: ABC transporter permease [Eubacteriales bacterium]|nr:ABC transporter permease [Eubacteriales bacterium]